MTLLLLATFHQPISTSSQYVSTSSSWLLSPPYIFLPYPSLSFPLLTSLTRAPSLPLHFPFTSHSPGLAPPPSARDGRGRQFPPVHGAEAALPGPRDHHRYRRLGRGRQEVLRTGVRPRQTQHVHHQYRR